jgi:hypothetical protein
VTCPQSSPEAKHSDDQVAKLDDVTEAYDIPMVARKLSLAEGTVYKLIVDGHVFAIATTPNGSRKTWRIPRWALEAYLRGERPDVSLRRRSRSALGPLG